MFSIWGGLGFTGTPYDNETLHADAVGSALLVGRDDEVRRLQRAIASGGSHPSVEGPTGVGKSSLIAVAAYRMQEASENEQSRTLFIPARSTFQAPIDRAEFEAHFYREIAQTLIHGTESIRKSNLDVPDVDALDKWLNSPQYRSASGGAVGFSTSYGSTANATSGFSTSGFRELVSHELRRVFPERSNGAIVCVLDNLELLATVSSARETLEALRDTVFSLHGVRWVLCGSRGIVSRARSARLSGFFQQPQIIGPISLVSSIELVRRRLEYFDGGSAYAPVTPDGFEYLYRVLNRNLRDALAYSQTFSEWMYERYFETRTELPDVSERDLQLARWITATARSAKFDSRSVPPRGWDLLEAICSNGGQGRADEHVELGFNKQQQFGSLATVLVNNNLATREVDPEDGTRHIVVATPTGWLVHHVHSVDRDAQQTLGDL